LAALFLPNLFLFFLYGQNAGQLRLEHVMVLAVGLGFIGLVGFLALWFISKSKEIAIFLALGCWVFFWFFEGAAGLFGIETGLGRLIVLAVFLAAILGASLFVRLYMIRRRKIDFAKAAVGFNAGAAVICVLFIFNFVMALIGSAGSLAGTFTVRLDDENTTPYIRREFNVDVSTPNPDIYWIHMDGMLSFATMERFFNDPQDDLRQELESRGFVIDDDAMLYAGATWIAMPALFSPGFYDDYFGRLLDISNHLVLSEERYHDMNRYLNPEIGNFALRVQPYPEFFHALMAAGYTTVQHSTPGHGITPLASNIFYYIDYPMWSVGVNEGLGPRFPFFAGAESLIDLMAATTPFSIIERQIRNFGDETDWQPIPISDRVEPLLVTYGRPAVEHERMLLASLIDSFEIAPPKMIFTAPMFTHRTMWLHFFDGHPDPWDTLHPDLNNPFTDDVYLNAHKYAAQIMLNMINLILENDPYAVIVLQSDHGFRIPYTQNYLREAGKSDHELFELIHSTMSAVRIPERYGGLEAPLAPINISRELINRFVGHNYEMAQPHINPISP
jgi:hypothetical protein